MAALIGIVLLSAWTYPEPTQLPTVAADALTIREVRHSPDALLVERPAGAREGATSSVFVVDVDGARLQRVAVQYGRASASMIQIVNGVSHGDQIVVSDMRAWDAFERIQLTSR